MKVIGRCIASEMDVEPTQADTGALLEEHSTGTGSLAHNICTEHVKLN